MEREIEQKRFFAATWNVRSLVEDTGDARVCRAAPGRIGTEVDKKFDFLVEELKKYRIDIAGIQETKWFGSDVWQSGGSTLLHSGRA